MPDWAFDNGSELAVNWTVNAFTDRSGLNIMSTLSNSIVHLEEATRLGADSTRLFLARGNAASALKDPAAAVPYVPYPSPPFPFISPCPGHSSLPLPKPSLPFYQPLSWSLIIASSPCGLPLCSLLLSGAFNDLPRRWTAMRRVFALPSSRVYGYPSVPPYVRPSCVT
jgi:hypothetical protein